MIINFENYFQMKRFWCRKLIPVLVYTVFLKQNNIILNIIFKRKQL